jgi:DNA-binding transcriptional MerR regulator
MTGQAIGIGELACATGCKVQTIRYYRRLALMPEPQCTQGNQRRYAPAHI